MTVNFTIWRMDSQIITLLGFGLVAGIRHGFDIDHIAAITDIVSSQSKNSLALLYATLYALGHGIMVIALGTVLLAIGQKIPQYWDTLFGKFIGITLIFLGFYVLFSIFRNRQNFKLKSKWMLVFDAISFGYHKLLHNFRASHHHPKVKSEKYGIVSVTGIGMIHGVGAETPTQIGAFLVLLGIDNTVTAISFLLFFVLGIFISNLAVAAFSLYGYKKVLENHRIYMGVGIATAIFSIALGISFLV
ncbi:MAG: hypothetical protein AAB414_04095 [Patescibacteria group bacterium]